MSSASKQLRFKRVVSFIHLLLKNCLTTIALEIKALGSNAILVLKKHLAGALQEPLFSRSFTL